MLNIQIQIHTQSPCLLQQTQYLICMQKNEHKYDESGLKEANKYQDIFDVFLHIVMLRMPTAFILINMILMIWLVQTINSSFGADSVPRSLYFFAPFLAAQPITAIQFSTQSGCQPGFQQLSIKTFPAITSANLKHSNLTKWKQSLTVCAKKSQKLANFSAICKADQKFCSGICVNANNTDNCPITSIRKLYTLEPFASDQQIFYESSDKNYKYVYSRSSKNTHIVGISAQYQYRCANEYYYDDTFDSFEAYWNASHECGAQGYLSPQSYHAFDMMGTVQFLFVNSIWSEQINKIANTTVTQFGYLNKIKFKNKTAQCQQAEILSHSLSQKLTTQPITGFYSKNLLIISFVLFTLCWAWLIVVYCCQIQLTLLKSNIAVLLLCAIQFIAIAFIYYQNLQLVSLQDQISKISSCIDEPMSAFTNWSFGVTNRYPMIAIIFVCSSFLLMQIVSYFMSYCVYVEYDPPLQLNYTGYRDIGDARRYLYEQQK